MGYASTCSKGKIIQAVSNGLNVIFWFSIDLIDDNGNPRIVESAVQPLPNITCIVEVARELELRDLRTTHMVTVGGWGAPDPVTTFSSEDMWHAWKAWNAKIEALGLPGGFDGIDWDMEGASDYLSPSNILSIEMLDLVGEMSQHAKRDGYLVSMVPPESYLDTTTSAFDMSLLHPYSEWEGIETFFYHGHNAYAYLLAKYGQETFDIVSIQLYESYTHLLYNTTVAPLETRQSASDYLISYIPDAIHGWEVDFASYPSAKLPSQRVSVSKTALCIGLANGWITQGKNALVMPDEAQVAYETLKAHGLEPRGFVFWEIEAEGEVPPGQQAPLYMAKGLNAFLHTRREHRS